MSWRKSHPCYRGGTGGRKKQRWPNKATADWIATSMEARSISGQHSYLCPSCHGWHNGHGPRLRGEMRLLAAQAITVMWRRMDSIAPHDVGSES